MNLPTVGQIISLKIHGIGSGGEGVGYFNGYTVFVDGALPGETVEVKLTLCQKRHGWGDLLSIATSASNRMKPVCPLFGRCGGCQLMHLAYESQLDVKRQRVVDAMVRIGKIEDCNVAECIASPSSLSYRNKIQLPVQNGANGLKIGLYARGSHDLVEVEKCYIHGELGEEVYRSAREILMQSGIEAYDPITGKGELRHLIIKSAVHTGESLVIFVTNQEPTPLLKRLAKEITKKSPAIRGVVHNRHAGKENVILGRKFTVLEGNGYICEKLCELTFKISPASFFQINPKQAEQLYTKALEFAELSDEDVVLDAYCGVGTLSLVFAKHAKKVIGVECVPDAIEDAKENAKLNGIENVQFVCAASEDWIGSMASADVVLLNPPRKGCELSFLEGLNRLRPKKIVYVSCDPATLARDLKHLQDFGYRIDAIQPFDMFPQTAHVECVAKLYRR